MYASSGSFAQPVGMNHFLRTQYKCSSQERYRCVFDALFGMLCKQPTSCRTLLMAKITSPPLYVTWPGYRSVISVLWSVLAQRSVKIVLVSDSGPSGSPSMARGIDRDASTGDPAKYCQHYTISPLSKFGLEYPLPYFYAKSKTLWMTANSGPIVLALRI